MNRTVAILLTALTALLCGLPGLSVICLAVLGLIGTQLPDYKATTDASPADLTAGFLILVCLGSVLIFIPVIVGFFSYRLSALAGSFDDAPMQPPE